MEKQLAILMADLTGYTAMTDAHGGESAARIVGKYMSIVGEALYGTARLMQRVGDQVVITAENASDLFTTATRVNTLTHEEQHFLNIHAGLHYGAIYVEDGNLFGSTINVAARIMNLASRGQILCSSAFLSQLPRAAQPLFRSIGIQKLKNVLTDIELFEMESSTFSNNEIDPVCHMHIATATTRFEIPYKGNTYYFCSQRCLTLFQNEPDQFVS
ncbi:MAG TPA: YHS domain-containing protein [Chryseolinea sp.]|nr:YHS domain-containing protein [Chryseolinea sp.]